MKKYKFPETNDEKFMSESYMWNEISCDNLKFRYFNEIIYIAEYLNDGLSYNIKKILKNNFNNTMLLNNQIVGIKMIPFGVRYKACINYYRYGLYGNCNMLELLKKSNSKLLSVFSMPIALILQMK